MGAAAPQWLPARRQPRRPRGVAAGARLRRQSSRSHHRDAAALLDPRWRPRPPAHPAEQGIALYYSLRPQAAAASARERAAGGTVQAESGAVGVWTLRYVMPGLVRP